MHNNKGIHMPKKNVCSQAFINQLCSGEKSWYFSKAVSQRHVFTWEELSIKNNWNMAMAIPGFASFIPDDWSIDKRRYDRAFFWAIFATYAPELVDSLIKQCNMMREA